MVSTAISHRTWGGWPSIRLATDAVELEVVSEVGARVVSLRDTRRDREWLASGEPPAELTQMAWADERVVFGGRESFGWDECLPTTSVCADPLAPDGPALRDHGDQWGRGAYLALDEAGGAVEHTWSVPRWDYRMHRRLSFADAQTVLAEYLLVSHADVPLPISWAQHPVLQLEPGSRIELPGVARARRSWQHGIDLPEEVAWPLATTLDGLEVDLGRVRTEAGWAAVLYAEAARGARALAPDGARLELEWDRDFAPVLRVWLSYGGWPPGGPPSEQVALEPCTSMHDDLAGAMAAGRERVLQPGAEVRWWVRLRLA
jgi:galactose mutarotase-like enzyme